MRKTLLISCFAIGLLFKLTGNVPHATDASSLRDASPIIYPLITKIVGRKFTIEVSAGPTEPVYTVIGEDGNRVVDHITLAAMKQTNPDLFNSISPALPTGNVDASLGDSLQPLGD